ncbi:thioredoxin family protein [Patescibacteria group bacterium]|nr:thioredoxin family protein [Patescibacteria group bacterium]
MGDETIKVFSTPTCPYCTMLKEYLEEKNIEYEEIDVSQDQKQAETMVKKSGQMGVPQVWINDEVVIGFDKDKINELLDIKE